MATILWLLLVSVWVLIVAVWALPGELARRREDGPPAPLPKEGRKPGPDHLSPALLALILTIMSLAAVGVVWLNF